MTVRDVPDTLFRSPAGRLHLTKRCSGGATPSTVRAVHLSQEGFEEAVRLNLVCRCVNVYKENVMKNDRGDDVPTPATVPATTKFLELLADSAFDVLEDFHPGFESSVTLVDRATRSAITIVIVESAEEN